MKQFGALVLDTPLIYVTGGQPNRHQGSNRLSATRFAYQAHDFAVAN